MLLYKGELGEIPFSLDFWSGGAGELFRTFVLVGGEIIAGLF